MAPAAAAAAAAAAADLVDLEGAVESTVLPG